MFMNNIIMSYIYWKNTWYIYIYISWVYFIYNWINWEYIWNYSFLYHFINHDDIIFDIKNLWSWSVKIFKISITYVMICSITIWRNSWTFPSYYVLRFTSWLRFVIHDVVELEKLSIAMTGYISFLIRNVKDELSIRMILY